MVDWIFVTTYGIYTLQLSALLGISIENFSILASVIEFMITLHVYIYRYLLQNFDIFYSLFYLIPEGDGIEYSFFFLLALKMKIIKNVVRRFFSSSYSSLRLEDSI